MEINANPRLQIEDAVYNMNGWKELKINDFDKHIKV